MGYKSVKKQIVPRVLANWYENKRVPLWVLHHIHMEKKVVGSIALKQKQIRDEGISTLCDVLKRNDGICRWEELPLAHLPMCAM